MKDTDLKRSMKHRTKIQRLTRLFQSKKAELSAGYQGYHELLGFVDHCQRWGITERGQEKALDGWIDLLERWPFVGGAPTGPLSHQQRQRTRVRDGFVCTMCGRPADEVHHQTSRSNGGRNKPENLTSLCSQCHEKIHQTKSTVNKK
ncbi:MAG: HNH endonuclease [ANME-2 cluster archaeon]|nr:HNH endonuclease [ANME-2 cluster archaeon]